MADAWQNRIVRHCEMSLAELKANPRNWRTHPQAQRDALSGVLRDVGIVQSVIYNERTGLLVDGHARVEEAAKAGVAALPVTVVDLSDEEEALILATLDPVAALAGADAAALDAVLRDVETSDAAVQQLPVGLAADHGLTDCDPVKSDPGADEDHADELQARWQTVVGQEWEIGAHRLVIGDATDAATLSRAIAGEPVGCLVFDPPWDAAQPRVPVDAANVIAFCDGRRAGDVIGRYGAPAWVFVWDCVSCWYTAHRPLARMKLALWYGNVSAFNQEGAFYDGGPERRPTTIHNAWGDLEYRPDERGKHLADVYVEPISQAHAEKRHRHEKPNDWMRLLIGDCSSGFVFDPYCGSGASMVAAEQLKRPSAGIEIDPGAAAVTLERLSAMGLEPRLRQHAGAV